MSHPDRKKVGTLSLILEDGMVRDPVTGKRLVWSEMRRSDKEYHKRQITAKLNSYLKGMHWELEQ